jgi:hypothetical protein
MRAVLGDEQRFRFRQIEHLPGDVIDRHCFGQRRAARGAGSRIMVDRGIGGFRPAQRLSGMAGLTAGRLAGRFTQAADPRRLLQSVAGRWFAAVAAVQPETAFQVRQSPKQRRVLGTQLHNLGLQGRNHRIAVGRGRGAVATGGVVGRCHRHVDSYSPVTCQYPSSRP